MTGRQLVRYSVVGLISLVIGLTVFLPANVAAGWIRSGTPIELRGVTGTLLSGHARYVSSPQVAIDDLDWHLRPLALLVGHISVGLDVGSDLGGFTGTVSRSFFGNTSIDNLTGDASVNWIGKHGGYTFVPLSGRVDVDIDHAAFDGSGDIKALKGHIRLTNARWRLTSPPLTLGRVTARLKHGAKGLLARIGDSHGPLAIKGHAQLKNRRYVLDVRLRARSGAKKRLKTLLGQLGGTDSEGWHHIQQSGSL